MAPWSWTKVEVHTPEGNQLINRLELQLDAGDTLMITGKSGSGKTTLLRSLAQLWPYTSGTLTRPGRPQRDDVPVPDALCPAR